MNICFVLCRPVLPENVGACARALHTMGFRFLRLVAPCDHRSPRAEWMAHGSCQVLRRARVYPELTAAVHDMDLVIGTTARHRKLPKRCCNPEAVRAALVRKQDALRKVAVVFGPEDCGLRNDELAQCDLVSSIPAAQTYPSLNLAQAVMVYAYVLAPLAGLAKPGVGPAAPKERAFRVLKQKASRLLERIDCGPGTSAHARLMELLAELEDGRVDLFLALCERAERKLAASHGSPS